MKYKAASYEAALAYEAVSWQVNCMWLYEIDHINTELFLFYQI